MCREAQARADAAGVAFHEDALKEALATVVLDGGVHVNALLAMAAAGNVRAEVDALLRATAADTEASLSVDLLPVDDDDACDAADTDPAIPGATADMRAIMHAVLALGDADTPTHVATLMRFAPEDEAAAFEAWLRAGARPDNAPFVRALNMAMIDPNLSDESRAALEAGTFADSEDEEGPAAAPAAATREPPRRLVPLCISTELPARAPWQSLAEHVPEAGTFIDFAALPNSRARNALFALYNTHAGDATNVRMTTHRRALGAPVRVSHHSLRPTAGAPCTITTMMAVLTGLSVADVEARGRGRKRTRVTETKRTQRFTAGRARRLAVLEAAAVAVDAAVDGSD